MNKLRIDDGLHVSELFGFLCELAIARVVLYNKQPQSWYDTTVIACSQVCELTGTALLLWLKGPPGLPRAYFMVMAGAPESKPSYTCIFQGPCLHNIC